MTPGTSRHLQLPRHLFCAATLLSHRLRVTVDRQILRPKNIVTARAAIERKAPVVEPYWVKVEIEFLEIRAARIGLRNTGNEQIRHFEWSRAPQFGRLRRCLYVKLSVLLGNGHKGRVAGPTTLCSENSFLEASYCCGMHAIIQSKL
jgi:hypothetical protein